MNYTIDEKIYTANEGYVFISKITGIISKVLWLKNSEMFDNYDVIVEPTEEILEIDGGDVVWQF